MLRCHFAVVAVLACPLAPQKLSVFVLAGQSNMQGHAKVSTLDYIGDDPETAPLLAKMRDDDGRLRVCDRVWISDLTAGRDGEGEAFGPLTAGFGARPRADERGDAIGPELTFGITVAAAVSGPVLLIKTAWGGKSLHTDFRPPSAGPFRFGDDWVARQRQQGADLAALRAAKAEATGVYYAKMIAHVRRVLEDPARVCPAYDAGAGHELAGFVWFQGWNDMVDRAVYPDRERAGGYDAYSECLAHLIRDVRRDLEAPGLPFVIGVMGVGGALREGAPYAAVHGNFREAMAAPAAMPEFAGNVAAVQTAPFWDARLAEIADRREQVRGMARKLRRQAAGTPNEDGTMSEEEQRAWIDDYRAEVVGEERERLWRRGASNAAYHYLGCGKTLAQIGVAFAEAALALRG